VNETAAIGIICKTPNAGSSKTRLLTLLDASAAAALAGCFLQDISATIAALPESLGYRGYAVYAPEGSEQELRRFVPAHFGLICQRDATLGVVLLGATRHLLDAGHDVVVLVNADSPTLPPTLLADAVIATRAAGDRVVLGPATDGGYYLIALKKAHAHLFHDIAWSTSAVTAQTMQRAGELGLEAVCLAPWYDVDDEASLATLVQEVDGAPLLYDSGGHVAGQASATRTFLNARPELRMRLARYRGAS
jgi:rSAM/selenodomain-associated transferase 1